jgi:LPXTG-site transpeptidase (sortase) family protein
MGKTSKGNTRRLSAIGNFLIGLSVVGVLITFYPIIREEFLFRTTNIPIEKPVSESFSVRIPSLKINVPVTKDVDPWNQNEYRLALQNGVAHAKGSSLPDQDGIIFLFAHSSDVPWRLTRYNTAFYRLTRVNQGDEIIITYEGEDFTYKVREKKVVWPTAVEYLNQQEKNQLILQTCTPIGTSLKRLLVFADPE